MRIANINLMDYQTAGSSNGAVWTDAEATEVADLIGDAMAGIDYENPEDASDDAYLTMEKIVKDLGWFAIPEHTSIDIVFEG